MRVCRLNRIKIKDPEKWDQAKFQDFVCDRYIEQKNKKKDTEEPSDDFGSNFMGPQPMLVINEEVTVYEFAPKKFKEIREIDNIDNEKIKYSLSTKLNRNQVFKAGES